MRHPSSAPDVSGGGAGANFNPHGQPARGTLVSMFKLVYLLAANWLAYAGRGSDQGLPQETWFCLIATFLTAWSIPGGTVCRSLAANWLIGRATGPEHQTCTLCSTLQQFAATRKREVSRRVGASTGRSYATAAELANVAVVDAALPLAEVVTAVFDRITEVRLARYQERYEIA